MTQPTISSYARQSDLRRRLQFGALVCLALVALVRAVRDFEADPLIIAALSIVLIRVLAAEQRRNHEIGRKLDYLQALQKYGPLTAEDQEVIAALRLAEGPTPTSGKSAARRSPPHVRLGDLRMLGGRSRQ